MAPEKVLVTIRYMDREFPGDYELPARLPVRAFLDGLLEALVRSEPSMETVFRARKQGLFLQNGNRYSQIPEEDTLGSHGVWDGSCLYVLPLTH